MLDQDFLSSSQKTDQEQSLLLILYWRAQFQESRNDGKKTESGNEGEEI